MIGKTVVYLAVLSLFLTSSAQTEDQNQAQRSMMGVLQVSWVDPEEVTVRISGPGGYTSETAITGGQVFGDLEPGIYELAASKEGFQTLTQEIEISAGETASTELILQEGQQDQEQAGQGVLQVTWVDPEDVTIQVSGPDGYSTEAQVTGGQVFAELSPGTYEIAVSKEGFQSLSQDIEVRAGETVSTSFVLQQREDQQAAEQQPQQAVDEEPATDQPTQQVSFESLMTQGSQLYGQAGCSSCHGGEGGGSQGPRLSGNERLQEAAYVADIVIHGRGGMPGFGGRLSDEDIASLGTFIRNSWENDFGPLSPEEVQQRR
jgi:mono/diheme cytochrome c family protein